jgi:hypothetical protein
VPVIDPFLTGISRVVQFPVHARFARCSAADPDLCSTTNVKTAQIPLAATTITAPIRGQFGWLSESLKIPESQESIFKNRMG